jgi:glycosyltransferase involved in cell wall biosynthesis
VTDASSSDRADFTIVVTSCGRFDLLAQTLASLLAQLDQPARRILVIEDSGDSGVAAAVADLGAPVEVLVNQPQLGQMQSIDKAYATITTPYVFHCEDDWEFLRPGFIAESLAILNARADVSMVGLRPRGELNPLVRESAVERLGEIAYFALDPSLHPEYFSYSFNPGLRRMSDARAIGPFARLGHEGDVSYAFKRAGFRIANLEIPAVRHIGDGRHVDDPAQAKKARTPWQKLKRSFDKRVKRLKRALGG